MLKRPRPNGTVQLVLGAGEARCVVEFHLAA